MWHKPCRTFHPWCPCIKTRCLLSNWITPDSYKLWVFIVPNFSTITDMLDIRYSKYQNCADVPGWWIAHVWLNTTWHAPWQWCNLSQFNTLRLRQNGRHFADDILKCIFLNKNVSITIKISLKFVPKDSINNIPALVQMMAWHQPDDKPLFEAMMV